MFLAQVRRDAELLTYLLDEVMQSLQAGAQPVILLGHRQIQHGQTQTLRRGTIRDAALQRNGTPQVGVYLHVSLGTGQMFQRGKAIRTK